MNMMVGGAMDPMVDGVAYQEGMSARMDGEVNMSCGFTHEPKAVTMKL